MPYTFSPGEQVVVEVGYPATVTVLKHDPCRSIGLIGTAGLQSCVRVEVCLPAGCGLIAPLGYQPDGGIRLELDLTTNTARAEAMTREAWADLIAASVKRELDEMPAHW